MTPAVEQKIKPTCILITGRNPYLNDCVELFTRQSFSILNHVTAECVFDEQRSADLKPDYVFSFISNHILRGPLLDIPNVNFHPAPPEWPGKGSASFALFNSDTSFGSTAHIMYREVDSGPILKVYRFPILPGETCDSVFLHAEQGCLQLYYDILTHIALHRALPEPCGETWKRKAIPLKQFEEWLVADPADPESFKRKIESSRHSEKPGPFVNLHGYRFALVNTPATARKGDTYDT